MIDSALALPLYHQVAGILRQRIEDGAYPVGVRLNSAAVNRGFLVPQAGLQRDATGPYVLTVGPDDKVIQKRVVAEALTGPEWIVTDGLADGDRMIVSGTQNARPGASVAAVPYAAQAQAARDAGAAAPAGAAGR